MSWLAWAAVAVFVGSYVLIATERVHRVAAALGGAGLVLALGILDSDQAFYSRDTGIDWDVIFLLLGMMLVVGVLKRTGIFEYLAIRSATLAGGRPFRVLVLLVLVTAGLSAWLDNVTTILLVASVTLLVCDRLGVAPIPFLIAETLASNIGGTATLVGDPPNIIIASRAVLTFAGFFGHLLPVVLVVLAAFLLLSRVLFRGAMRADPDRTASLMALEERETITDPKMLARSLVVLGMILVGCLLQRQTGLAPSVAALVGFAVISAVVDNIPYVTAMTPVVASLIVANPALGHDGALWWALALGADLGGNATLVGASANVVVVGIVSRNGLRISFTGWLRYGLPAAALSIAISVPYILLRYT